MVGLPRLMGGGGMGVGSATSLQTGGLRANRACEAGVVLAQISHGVVDDARHRHRVGIEAP